MDLWRACDLVEVKMLNPDLSLLFTGQFNIFGTTSVCCSLYSKSADLMKSRPRTKYAKYNVLVSFRGAS